MTARTRRSVSLFTSDMAGFFIKMVLLVWAAVTVIVAAVTAGFAIYGESKVSIFDNIAIAPRYWILVSGMLLTAVCLRMYISHGVTRRRYFLAGTLTGICSTVIAAALVAATYLGEYLSYRALGWNQKFNGEHLFGGGGQFGLAFTEFTLVFISHFFAGWLIGSLYYRLNWMVATPLAVVAYGAAVVVEGYVSSGWPGKVMTTVDGFSASWQAATLMGLSVTALLALANWLLLRGVAIHPKKS